MGARRLDYQLRQHLVADCAYERHVREFFTTAKRSPWKSSLEVFNDVALAHSALPVFALSRMSHFLG